MWLFEHIGYLLYLVITDTSIEQGAAISNIATANLNIHLLQNIE